MNYDVDFFIEYFSGIPDEQWTTGNPGLIGPRRCAFGHCNISCYGEANTPGTIAHALTEILNIVNPHGEYTRCYSVYGINDGTVQNYQQPTPKARILAALRDVKARAEAALDEYELRPLTLTPAKEQVSV